MDGSVRLKKEDRIAEIVIDRPAKHNALTPRMYERIVDVCKAVNVDRDIRVAIIHGAGERAFCAGSDINALSAYADFWEWRNRTDYIVPIRTLRKPCIAAIKGWTLGGGFEIALACDLRVAARTAVFAAPEVTLGWVGAGGAAQHLTRLAGYGQAMRLLLTGARIDAEEAYRIGLVEWLVEPGEELAAARNIAQQIASYSSVATQAVKSAIRSAMGGNIEQGYQIENELMALCFAKAEKDHGSVLFKKTVSSRTGQDGK
ncbi:MAG: enoyl-CoA hydratase/isomerase family protein [Alphaproteobacteria bacterium]|nr:MAG: enoyl-CoA hydratase/isomerase family protein [Alphaproteobacteria bacterium]